MARLQLYRYAKSRVVLEFTFEEGEHNRQNKEDYIELLKKATNDLSVELSMAQNMSAVPMPPFDGNSLNPKPKKP